jgi:hypothetical protein
MKRALTAGLGVLALIVGVQAANAQGSINPNQYPNNASERYGAQPYEWYGAPGPMRRANGMCVENVDPLRGYGFQKPCPAPKAAAASQRTSRVAHHRHRTVVTR